MQQHSLTPTVWQAQVRLPAREKPPLAVSRARDYTTSMNTQFTHRPHRCVLLCSLVLAGLLSACGPKDIGADTSSENESRPLGVNAEDQMRYPIMGASRTQQLLYLQNRPDVMANTQQWRMQQFNRMHGLDKDVSPEDPAYRAVPKQRSPFKQ